MNTVAMFTIHKICLLTIQLIQIISNSAFSIGFVSFENAAVVSLKLDNITLLGKFLD